MLCSAEHSQKACTPIVVTLSGKSMLCSDEQPRKAQSSIVVTLFGMSMLCSDEHSTKAVTPIIVTLLGILYLSILFPSGNLIIVLNSLLNSMPSLDVYF